MLAFANRPELMKQYTTSSKYAGSSYHVVDDLPQMHHVKR